jgi:hypothetical protein
MDQACFPTKDSVLLSERYLFPALLCVSTLSPSLSFISCSSLVPSCVLCCSTPHCLTFHLSFSNLPGSFPSSAAVFSVHLNLSPLVPLPHQPSCAQTMFPHLPASPQLTPTCQLITTNLLPTPSWLKPPP